MEVAHFRATLIRWGRSSSETGQLQSEKNVQNWHVTIATGIAFDSSYVPILFCTQDPIYSAYMYIFP
jgi:hypothetical protein